jgi:hypothetical protein
VSRRSSSRAVRLPGGNSCALLGKRPPKPRLRFVVSSWRRGGHRFDLDNFVDPVLAVVGAPLAERRSLWATVEMGEQPGVGISEQPLTPAPPHATTMHLAAPSRRSVRRADRLVELVHVAQLGSDEPCGCTSSLAPTRAA